MKQGLDSYHESRLLRRRSRRAFGGDSLALLDRQGCRMGEREHRSEGLFSYVLLEERVQRIIRCD